MKLYFSLIISILLIAFTSDVNGQITDRGNFIIGGTLGFSAANSDIEQNISGQNQNVEGTTSTQLNFAPSIGYFLVRNFAFGIGLDYTFNTITEADGQKELDSDLLFGPFARFYFPVADDMAFFLESTLGFGSSNSSTTINGADQDIATNVFAFGIGPGFTIFSNQAIGIEAGIKYNFARSDADFTVNSESVNVLTRTNQFDFSVGLQFYFSRVRSANLTR